MGGWTAGTEAGSSPLLLAPSGWRGVEADVEFVSTVSMRWGDTWSTKTTWTPSPGHGPVPGSGACGLGLGVWGLGFDAWCLRASSPLPCRAWWDCIVVPSNSSLPGPSERICARRAVQQHGATLIPYQPRQPKQDWLRRVVGNPDYLPRYDSQPHWPPQFLLQLRRL